MSVLSLPLTSACWLLLPLSLITEKVDDYFSIQRGCRIAATEELLGYEWKIQVNNK